MAAAQLGVIGMQGNRNDIIRCGAPSYSLSILLHHKYQLRQYQVKRQQDAWLRAYKLAGSHSRRSQESPFVQSSMLDDLKFRRKYDVEKSKGASVSSLQLFILTIFDHKNFSQSMKTLYKQLPVYRLCSMLLLIQFCLYIIFNLIISFLIAKRQKNFKSKQRMVKESN